MTNTMDVVRGNIILSMGLLVLGLFMIVFGFHVGDLAQQVARAGQLLREAVTVESSEGARVAEIATYMAEVARAVFEARRWLVFGGVLATWLPVFARETPPVLRFGSGLLGILCFVAMFLTGSLP